MFQTGGKSIGFHPLPRPDLPRSYRAAKKLESLVYYTAKYVIKRGYYLILNQEVALANFSRFSALAGFIFGSICFCASLLLLVKISLDHSKPYFQKGKNRAKLALLL